MNKLPKTIIVNGEELERLDKPRTLAQSREYMKKEYGIDAEKMGWVEMFNAATVIHGTPPPWAITNMEEMYPVKFNFKTRRWEEPTLN